MSNLKPSEACRGNQKLSQSSSLPVVAARGAGAGGLVAKGLGAAGAADARRAAGFAAGAGATRTGAGAERGAATAGAGRGATGARGSAAPTLNTDTT